jgi:hypothetical protein
MTFTGTGRHAQATSDRRGRKLLHRPYDAFENARVSLINSSVRFGPFSFRRVFI